MTNLSDTSGKFIDILRATEAPDFVAAARHMAVLDARLFLADTTPELIKALRDLREEFGERGVRRVLAAVDVVDEWLDQLEPATTENINVAAARSYGDIYTHCPVCKHDLSEGSGEHTMRFGTDKPTCNCARREIAKRMNMMGPA